MVTKAKTILLVDDDDDVRRFCRIVLQACGYSVLEAGSGRKAVLVAEQYNGPIDLLVTDLEMPGLGGVALAEQIEIMRPGTTTLFLSGNIQEGDARLGEPKKTFLQKPFSVNALTQKTRQLLDLGQIN